MRVSKGCIECGINNTYNKDRICPACKKKSRNQGHILTKKAVIRKAHCTRCKHRITYKGDVCDTCMRIEQKAQIFELYRNGKSYQDLALEFDMSLSFIRTIINRANEDYVLNKSVRKKGLEANPCGLSIKRWPGCYGNGCYWAKERRCPAFENTIQNVNHITRQELLGIDL